MILMFSLPPTLNHVVSLEVKCGILLEKKFTTVRPLSGSQPGEGKLGQFLVFRCNYGLLKIVRVQQHVKTKI